MIRIANPNRLVEEVDYGNFEKKIYETNSIIINYELTK
jgi:hypothetical protein